LGCFFARFPQVKIMQLRSFWIYFQSEIVKGTSRANDIQKTSAELENEDGICCSLVSFEPKWLPPSLVEWLVARFNAELTIIGVGIPNSRKISLRER